MIYYFGCDSAGKYVQAEGSATREYVSDEQWQFFIEQARHRPPVVGGDPVKIAITISGVLEKYDAESGVLVERRNLDSETSEMELHSWRSRTTLT